MTTEDDFQRMLDLNPDDHATRLILADFLDEAGDIRATGYRALGELRLVPNFEEYDSPWGYEFDDVGCWSWWCVFPPDSMGAATLPQRDWHAAILTAHHYQYVDGTRGSKDFFTRREAEDAAALAFAKLPPERRAAILCAASAT